MKKPKNQYHIYKLDGEKRMFLMSHTHTSATWTNARQLAEVFDGAHDARTARSWSQVAGSGKWKIIKTTEP